MIPEDLILLDYLKCVGYCIEDVVVSDVNDHGSVITFTTTHSAGYYRETHTVTIFALMRRMYSKIATGALK